MLAVWMVARFLASQKMSMKRSDWRRARRISTDLASAMPQQPTENASRMRRTARTTGPEPTTMSRTLSWRPGSVSASWASTAPPQATLVEKSGIIASGVPYKRPRPPPTARPYSRVRGQSNTRRQSAPLLDRRGAKWNGSRAGGCGVHGEDPRRDQWVRPHRQERAARLPRRRGARVRCGQRHHERKDARAPAAVRFRARTAPG